MIGFTRLVVAALLAAVPHAALAKDPSCRMQSFDGRIMTPVFSADGTWKTPRRSASYSVSDGAVAMAFPDGRTVILSSSGGVMNAAGKNTGRVTPRSCAHQVARHVAGG